MASTLETLDIIYERIKNKDEWCQGVLYSKEGKCCLVARLYEINDLDRKESVKERLYQALEELKQLPDISNYNDSHTHNEVVQLVALAIDIEKRVAANFSKLDLMTRIY